MMSSKEHKVIPENPSGLIVRFLNSCVSKEHKIKQFCIDPSQEIGQIKQWLRMEYQVDTDFPWRIELKYHRKILPNMLKLIDLDYNPLQFIDVMIIQEVNLESNGSKCPIKNDKEITCQFRHKLISITEEREEIKEFRIDPTRDIQQIKEAIKKGFNMRAKLPWKLELVFRGEILGNTMKFNEINFNAQKDYINVVFFSGN